MNYTECTALCGIDCFNCELYVDNITDAMRQRIAPLIKGDTAQISCAGCRQSGCLLLKQECATKKCAQERGVTFCSDCTDFPCEKFTPSTDGADRRPHNLKIYNLLRIKKEGIDSWARDAKNIRERYFRGKMVIGSGPSLD
ncbi:DUF3795 domain-containing protein [Myxococcota bacterium]|nr:DUF3795 domain-containing protein [Myxococcota bacterium]MBU1537087.1 DUF3795 domain-containing protein [Myxococcota bacterium]